ncbi:DUF2121 family protein [Methanotorris formicicus]|uniref:Uncharacterized conserved protein UCP019262 n=1 Tax=Methanotorris formicicus Mc-S-70 TaxID=647171 RepID=H1KXB3_9EURY|nr:DUF2121 family protein [Methanotorris formicicus]EHP88325.1 Uncharacterized conserved protein UCP019262 [Methanotorris formicicus Mc-S-70]
MSVIIGYYGKNGAVLGGDKRRIMFRGDVEKRKMLEKLLYNGEIKNDEELLKKAEELGIKLHIEDGKKKVRKIGNDVLVGEVKTIGIDSKRRRVYLTKGKCMIVDVFNDEIKNKLIKTGSGVVVFGNKYVKKIAEDEFKKIGHRLTMMSLEEIKDIIENIFKKYDTPSVSKEYIVVYTTKECKNLEEVVKKDLDELFEYRETLRKKMIDFSKVMTIVNKIVKNGEVGVVKNGKLVLYDKYIAIDKICPNPNIFNDIEIRGDVEEGDVVVIENGEMKIKGKNTPVFVDHIICEK